MSERRDLERLLQSFLAEGPLELPDPSYDEVRDRMEHKRQRAFIGPWRTPDVNRYLKLGLAAAAVVLIAVVGYNLLPGLGVGGPGATPSPSPSLIARGSFVEHDWGQVEFVATREGSRVTGTMTIAARDGWGPITVDLQCSREIEDGLVLIGGYVTVGNQVWPAETLAWIALQRGSPDLASVGADSLTDVPATQSTNCLAYLDATVQFYRGGGYTIPLHVLDGGVAFGR